MIEDIIKNKESLMTVKQAAFILNMTSATLKKLTKDGAIKAYQVGQRYRYTMSDIKNSLIEIKS